MVLNGRVDALVPLRRGQDAGVPFEPVRLPVRRVVGSAVDSEGFELLHQQDFRLPLCCRIIRVRRCCCRRRRLRLRGAVEPPVRRPANVLDVKAPVRKALGGGRRVVPFRTVRAVSCRMRRLREKEQELGLPPLVVAAVAVAAAVAVLRLRQGGCRVSGRQQQHAGSEQAVDEEPEREDRAQEQDPRVPRRSLAIVSVSQHGEEVAGLSASLLTGPDGSANLSCGTAVMVIQAD
jgi:hypothetical protein